MSHSSVDNIMHMLIPLLRKDTSLFIMNNKSSSLVGFMIRHTNVEGWVANENCGFHIEYYSRDINESKGHVPINHTEPLSPEKVVEHLLRFKYFHKKDIQRIELRNVDLSPVVVWRR
jgi:hypothetical protein